MNTSDPQSISSQLIRQGFVTVLRWLTPAVLAVGYLIGLAAGLAGSDIWWCFTRVLLPVFLVGGVALSWGGLFFLLRRELEGADEPEEVRAARLMRLPWKMAVTGASAPILFVGLVHAVAAVLVFDRSFLHVGSGLLIALAAGVALVIPVATRLEQELMPSFVEAQRKLGKRPEGQGWFWLRQSWLVPGVLGASLVTAVPLAALVAGSQVSRLHDAQTQALRESASLTPEQAALVAEQLGGYRDGLLWSLSPGLLVLGAFILLVPSLSAWLLMRRQARAMAAIQASLDSLVSGTPRPPEWASTDEVGDMGSRMGAVLERFSEIPATLQEAASQLSNTCSIIDSAGSEHREHMQQQVSALQEARVTSTEIRQTSALASRRVETVLQVVARAEKLGESGEAALEKTFAGLSTIREFADGIRGRVIRVQECAAQIGDIAISVKDLASQSNVLSINAAIEAARSGEHGSGFAVVAQEFRRLTHQSIRETVRISGILDQVRDAISELVTMSEQGSKQVEGGLEMVKSSGESLRELTAIIQENAAAARMIAAAVSQQDAGISQVVTAISQLATGMDEAMKRMETTLEASRSLEGITQQVQEIARRHAVSA